MYHFTREDFVNVVDHHKFQSGLQLMLDETFNFNTAFSKTWFRGDQKLIQELIDVPRTNYASFLKNYSLPYLSKCEDPEKYIKEYGDMHIFTLSIKQDLETRRKVIDDAKDRYSPSWWSFLHECEAEAVFLMYPLAKILFPENNTYIYRSPLGKHTVIITAPKNWTKLEILNYFKTIMNISFNEGLTRDKSKPMILDIIGFTLDEPMNWIFEHWDKSKEDESFDEKFLIDEEKIINWYIVSYGYHNLDMEKFHKFSGFISS